MTGRKLKGALARKEDFFKALGESAGHARPEFWGELLDSVWPVVDNDEFGYAQLSAEDAQWLQSLCDVFGLGLQVQDCSAEVLGHVYDVCVLGLGPFVEKKLNFPNLDLKAYLFDWSPDWVRYIEAVALRRQNQANELTRLLSPLSPAKGWPPGVHVLKKDFSGKPLPVQKAA